MTQKKVNRGRGTIVEISYIVVSTQGDSITVQVENTKDQYVIESRDNRVSCSYRKSLKLYKQEEKIAVHCNNMYYDCEVMYEISLLEPKKENDNEDQMPQCHECVGEENSSCFESIYLPVHSWYYLYYDGYDNGSYLDFLVSSHKKDKMRIEVQNNDGLFYLVSTRRDKVRCSDPQKSVPVRWKSPRIAVYCYNNYVGCKFSVFARIFPMNKDSKSANGASLMTGEGVKHMGYYESPTPTWSEWSEWSNCIENKESHRNGIGQRTRERKCIQTTVDFVHPHNSTHLSEEDIKARLMEADIPYCEGSSTEVQNCQLDSMEHSWQNILIFVFILTALLLCLGRGKNTTTRLTIDTSNYNEDVLKTNNVKSPDRMTREVSPSENSPLLNTYFRRYD